MYIPLKIPRNVLTARTSIVGWLRCANRFRNILFYIHVVAQFYNRSQPNKTFWPLDFHHFWTQCSLSVQFHSDALSIQSVSYHFLFYFIHSVVFFFASFRAAEKSSTIAGGGGCDGSQTLRMSSECPILNETNPYNLDQAAYSD